MRRLGSMVWLLGSLIAASPDRGRANATAKVRNDEFNCLGPFSDAQPKQCQELRFMVSGDPALEGAFKTPADTDAAELVSFLGTLSTERQSASATP